MDLQLKPLDPFNITVLNPNEYIVKHNCLPVTSFAIFEASSTRFHPDGLFSEVIFGQIGSKERLVKRGYYNLRTKIITPHLYKQVMSLKSYYKQIIAGKAYAKLDPETNDLVLTNADDPDGHTGFIWFCNILPSIKFAETSSVKRQIKVNLIYKYIDTILIDKFIVLPAGVRDLRVDPHGKVSPEEINKLYNGLFSLIQALPEEPNDDPIYDTIRLQIQNKALEIYEYIASLVEGKHGFAQGKLVARSVSYSSRNVITAPPMSKVSSSNSPQAFNVDEIMIPLFQAMKSSMPMMVNKIKTVFFDQIFASQSLTIPAIDPDTYELIYITLNNQVYNRFTTSEGINNLMSEFRNPHVQMKPAVIDGIDERTNKPKTCWLYLVYDDDNGNIYYFRSKSDFKEYIDRVQTVHPDSTLLETLANIPINPDDYVIAGSGGAALLLGEQYPVYKDIVFLTRNEQVAKGFQTYLSSESAPTFVNPKIEVMTPEELKFLDRTSGSLVTVDKYHVLSHDELLNWYLRRGKPKAKDKELLDILKLHTFDPNKIRPLTWVELFYVACYLGLVGKYTTSTRHPVLLLSNITLNKIKLMSTTVSRIVKFRGLNPGSVPIIFPHYPVLTSTVKGSMSVFPAHLEKYDGRMVAIVGCNTLYL